MPPALPQNSLSLKEWFDYAEWLATNLSDIGHTPTDRHYTRLAFPELQSIATLDLRYPALLADTPEAEGVDNSSNNLLTRRYLAWTIVKPVTQTGNWSELLEAEDECERIALQVLARLRKDRIHRGGQVFGDVDMNGWQGDTVSPFVGVGYAAYRIMVPVLNTERRLVYDPARWIGEDGPPLLVDVSGLSCTNLNHPTLGLTTQQRLTCILGGYDFADAATLAALTVQQRADLEDEFGGSGSGGVCPPTTVNGTTSNIPNITVVQGGVQVGTLNPVTGEHSVPPEQCGPFTLNIGRGVFATVENPCNAELSLSVVDSNGANVDHEKGVITTDIVIPGLPAPPATVQLRDSAGNNIGSADTYAPGANTTKTAPDGSVQLRDSAGNAIGSAVAVRSNQSGLDVTAPDGSVQLRDSAGNNIGSAAPVRSNQSNVPVTAPDGSVQLRDSAGNAIGSPVAVRSNQSGLDVTAPDGSAQLQDSDGNNIGSPAAVRSGQIGVVLTERSLCSRLGAVLPANVQTQILDCVTEPSREAIRVILSPLKFALAAFTDTSITFTVTADEAGTYGTYTQDGGSGTLTYSLNGGAFVALSGSIVLAIGNTIAVRRTNTAAAGFIRWAQ
jgi:hypothetical protein